jgi:hypothetical protein
VRIDKFREIIKERIRISEECNDEWDYGIENCWKQEIEILTEDIPSSIQFLMNECTADEYSWISEVIDDVVEKTNSHEFVECYKNLRNKFPEEYSKYNIMGSIEYAEAMLHQES